ncbi:hypothetical protein Gotri_000925 [Gossypium trilobum]|uniref:Uncharacterized protein n=1 Tax=Gossypium trilobum TaxID=34281 RepID=A0A7J9FDA2_9ROSI|nr:hypothetical protein [Gossypium trilobum]
MVTYFSAHLFKKQHHLRKNNLIRQKLS